MPILRLTISSLSSLSHSFRSFLFVLSILFIALMNSASARILVDVKDPDTLKALENSGFGVAHVFEAHSNTNNLDTLYNQSELYRSFVHSIGKDIKHDPKTDQLPTIIPKNSGDIPEMVRLMRGIEDKGKRSSKDKKGC